MPEGRPIQEAREVMRREPIKRLKKPTGVTPKSHAAAERLTPPCPSCKYPLVNSDKSCPRCGAPVPWPTEVDPPREPRRARLRSGERASIPRREAA
jgi:hypothetical protein